MQRRLAVQVVAVCMALVLIASCGTPSTKSNPIIGNLYNATAVPTHDPHATQEPTPLLATSETTAAIATAASTLAIEVTSVSASTAVATAGTSAGLPVPLGDPREGQRIFTSTGTCFTCHDVSNNVRIVGPSLLGIASRAGTRIPGKTAEEYIYQSILEPNAFIVPEYTPNLMPTTFRQMFNDKQIGDLIAYLMTLK